MNLISTFIFEWIWLNIGQNVLLLGDTPIILENISLFMILYHVIFLLMGYFIYKGIITDKKDKIVLSVGYITATTIDFIYEFWLYKNLHKAIYECLKPNHILIIGIALILIISATKINRHSKIEFLIPLELMIVFIVVPFLETFLSNPGEFQFGISDVIWKFILTIAVVLIVFLIIVNYMKEKCWNLLVPMALVCLCACIQEMLLN